LRVWVTRTQPGADATAARLRELGHEPVVAPLLEVRTLADAAMDLDGVGALAFTSANAVAVFAAREGGRGWPVFAVGDATADAAREAGFGRVGSSGGDVAALAGLITAAPPQGVVLHPGAAELAGDLAGDLAAAGIAVRSVALYETATLPVPEDVRRGWSELDAVLIHSPKAARALAAAGLPTGPRLLCISEAAAAPLQGLGPVEAAVRPDEESLLDLLAPPRRGFPPAFWLAILFSLACVAAGWWVAAYGPALWPEPEVGLGAGGLQG
jgi:uroporphyrinogen-III synthase